MQLYNMADFVYSTGTVTDIVSQLPQHGLHSVNIFLATKYECTKSRVISQFQDVVFLNQATSGTGQLSRKGKKC